MGRQTFGSLGFLLPCSGGKSAGWRNAPVAALHRSKLGATRGLVTGPARRAYGWGYRGWMRGWGCQHQFMCVRGLVGWRGLGPAGGAYSRAGEYKRGNSMAGWGVQGRAGVAAFGRSERLEKGQARVGGARRASGGSWVLSRHGRAAAAKQQLAAWQARLWSSGGGAACPGGRQAGSQPDSRPVGVGPQRLPHVWVLVLRLRAGAAQHRGDGQHCQQDDGHQASSAHQGGAGVLKHRHQRPHQGQAKGCGAGRGGKG